MSDVDYSAKAMYEKATSNNQLMNKVLTFILNEIKEEAVKGNLVVIVRLYDVTTSKGRVVKTEGVRLKPSELSNLQKFFNTRGYTTSIFSRDRFFEDGYAHDILYLSWDVNMTEDEKDRFMSGNVSVWGPHGVCEVPSMVQLPDQESLSNLIIKVDYKG